VNSDVLKSLHSMIKNHPDEYRLAYGLFMGRDELIDVEGKSEREELLERVRGTAGMQEKWEHTVSAATPGELKGIAQKITADEIAAKIEDGTLTEHDEGAAEYRKVKKQEVKVHTKAIEAYQESIDRAKELHENAPGHFKKALELQGNILDLAKKEAKWAKKTTGELTPQERNAQARREREVRNLAEEKKKLLTEYNTLIKYGGVSKDAQGLFQLQRELAKVQGDLKAAQEELKALD
jgi:hypothetical protein